MSALTRLLLLGWILRGTPQEGKKCRYGWGRLFFLLLAISAASCLVVWIVGGYKALFSEAVQDNSRPLGRYDLLIQSPQQGRRGGMGGAFPGPLSSKKVSDSASTSTTSSPKSLPGEGREVSRSQGRGGGGDFGGERPRSFDPYADARLRDGSIHLDHLPADTPAHLRRKIQEADTDQNGILSFVEERALYPEEESPSGASSSGMPTPSSGGLASRGGGEKIPEDFVQTLLQDENILNLDTMRQVTAFVFSPKEKNFASLPEENSLEGDASFEEPSPEGIDPELHRLGLAAYRATMGTPVSFGVPLTGTDALQPPYALEVGRWFDLNHSDCSEVVLGRQAQKRYRLQVGDSLWVLSKTDEFQLKVVGILDEERNAHLYIPMSLAERISPNDTTSRDSLGIVLDSKEEVDNFKKVWSPILSEKLPSFSLMSNEDMVQRLTEEQNASDHFRLQSMTGSLLAILAAVMIIYTALSIGVEQRRREIALLRSIGLERRKIAAVLCSESLLLAILGWLGGLLAGWLILLFAVKGMTIPWNDRLLKYVFIGIVLGIFFVSLCQFLGVERKKWLSLLRTKTFFFSLSRWMGGFLVAWLAIYYVMKRTHLDGNSSTVRFVWICSFYGTFLIAFVRSLRLDRGKLTAFLSSKDFHTKIMTSLGSIFFLWIFYNFLVGRRSFHLNFSAVTFSFVCSIIGAFLATLFPMIRAMRVNPLEAVAGAHLERERNWTRSQKNRFNLVSALLGIVFIALDLFLIYRAPGDTARRAVLHSGIGIASLALGVFFLIPSLLWVAEKILLPILAFCLRFDRRLSAEELSRHLRRAVTVVAMLSAGGGLYVLMQVWGFSMLKPFLPDRQMPDAFVSFFPEGITSESVQELKFLPEINPEKFEEVALEQAAFYAPSLPEEKREKAKGQFANLVFFGLDVDRGFAQEKGLVKLDLIEGNLHDALEAMKQGRGVIVNDAVTVDYGLKLGDTLQVTDPKNPRRILEYPIVGVTVFHGWQWLSKTGGVRRNFARSGGIVFASDQTIQEDFSLDSHRYFWFDYASDVHPSYEQMEQKLDRIAQKSFEQVGDTSLGNAAYVKLSTREQLYHSIADRAKSVIFGMSLMPLITLVLTSIALVAVMVNSVRDRNRWFGIMRSIAVERGKLFRMILTESILLGLTAAMASLIFGAIAAAGALKLGGSMFGSAEPTLIFPAKGLFLGLGLLVLLTILAALVPAIRIGRTPPLELFHSEE